VQKKSTGLRRKRLAALYNSSASNDDLTAVPPLTIVRFDEWFGWTGVHCLSILGATLGFVADKAMPDPHERYSYIE
jgi:hypothetical protein